MTQETKDVWSRLAAPFPDSALSFRLDGKPAQRDGKWFARFVWYYEWPVCQRRLDAVVPGEWDMALTALPGAHDEDGTALNAYQCRLSILGVHRDDVGTGRDPKAAATDAMKRAVRHFGVGMEAWEFEGPLWVQVDGDGKYAKPVEDPAAAFGRLRAKQQGKPAPAAPARTFVETGVTAPVTVTQADVERTFDAAVVDENGEFVDATASGDEPMCPKCGGKVWDNRASKRNPKAPDFKCRDKTCDGVIWPPKAPKAPKAVAAAREAVAIGGGDEIPF